MNAPRLAYAHGTATGTPAIANSESAASLAARQAARGVGRVSIVVGMGHSATMGLGALAWLVGNGLWWLGFPIFRVTPWWVSFLLLTIAGERLELSHVMLLRQTAVIMFITSVSLLFGGLLLTLFVFALGIQVSGAGLIALSLWLLRYDVVRRTLRQAGLPRFIALCLLPGYGWLMAGGALWMLRAAYFVGGPAYDAMLHAVLLGFVFSLIFGHAPLIIPAVTQIPLQLAWHLSRHSSPQNWPVSKTTPATVNRCNPSLLLLDIASTAHTGERPELTTNSRTTGGLRSVAAFRLLDGQGEPGFQERGGDAQGLNPMQLSSTRPLNPNLGCSLIERRIQMNAKHRLTVSVLVLLIALLPVTSVFAGSVSAGGITLSYPSYPLSGPALLSCEPWFESTANTITLTGIPDGSTVAVTLTWANPYSGGPTFRPTQTYANVLGGTLVVPVDYPMDTSTWPLWDQVTNERAIAVAVLIKVTKPDGTVVKLNSKQWWIRCLPPPPPAQGCTPGYWRQDQHFDSWVPTGYAPGDDFEAVFGVDASFDPHSLLDAVWLGGGGELALARHAVAALLNAAHPDVNYTYTVAEVIAGVQNAYATGDFETFKDLLDAANNAGCPLN